MVYNGLEMLQRHLHGAPEKEVEPNETVINPKLKQCFEVETKIEPFYTGGKIVALPNSRFVCKCNTAVKVVSTAETPIIKIEEGVEEDVECDVKHGSFGVTGTFECDMDEIISFDACPATNTLITSHKSQLLRLWNLRSHEVIKTIKSFHTIPINHTEIYKTETATLKRESDEPLGEKGDIVWVNVEHLTWATVAGNLVKVWNYGGNQVSKQTRVDGVPSLGFIKWDIKADPKNRRLFVAERNIYCIAQDSTQQYTITQTLEGHYSQVTGLEWGAENLMISAGRDKTLILWNTSGPQITKIKSLAFPGVIESTTLLNMKDLYIASLAGVIRHMDLDNFSLTPDNSLIVKDGDETTLTLHPPMNQGLASEAKQFFVSTHLSTLYEVGRSRSKKKSSKAVLRIHNQFVGSLDEILDVALWGKTQLAVANNTAVIKVYDLTTGSCQFLRGHTDIVLSLCAREQYLVSSSKDNRIIFWESGSNEPLKILEGHLASVSAVCFDPSKPNIYSVAEDNFLKYWSMDKCLKSVVAHENEIHAVDSSPNGNLVATASRDKTSKIWEGETLKLKGTLKGHKKSLWDVKFSLWDQLVITSSADTTLKIWNLSNFECIKTLQGHQSSVLRGRFINSGLQAVSAGTDGTLRTWDLRNSLCLTTLENSDDKIWALDSTPDGSLVITGSADAVLTIWKDITGQKVQESNSRRKTLLETEQKLQNVIQTGKWATAIDLAIRLKRPFALLRVIRSIPQDQAQLLPDIVSNLGVDEKKTLLEYIEKWNTNTKTSTEAQILFNIILKSNPPKSLSSLKVSSLLPYTEKHFKRLLKIQQDICIIKYLTE